MSKTFEVYIFWTESLLGQWVSFIVQDFKWALKKQSIYYPKKRVRANFILHLMSLAIRLVLITLWNGRSIVGELPSFIQI